jgi:hypothetical protein
VPLKDDCTWEERKGSTSGQEEEEVEPAKEASAAKRMRIRAEKEVCMHATTRQAPRTRQT